MQQPSEVAAAPQHRTFARDYYTPAGRSAPAQPREAVVVAMNQRRLVTLKRINDMKSSLASLVSSPRGSSSSPSPAAVADTRDDYTVSLEGPRTAHSAEDSRYGSSEVAWPHTAAPRHHHYPSHPNHHHAEPLTVVTPPVLSAAAPATVARGGPSGAQFLLDTQRQVEKLTLENHELVRRCLEQEERLRGWERTRPGEPQPPLPHDDVPSTGAGCDNEDGDVLKDSGEVSSPRELPFFARYGPLPPATRRNKSVNTSGDHSSSSDGGPHRDGRTWGGQLPEAVYRLLHRVSVCYPQIFEGIAATPEATPTALAVSSAPLATVEESRPPSRSQHAQESDLVARLSEADVCEVLSRMESALPSLASSSHLGDFLTEAGAELLEHVSTLEDEKQMDYTKVVGITEKLMKVNAKLKEQDTARQEQLRRVSAELDEARRQRGELVDQLAAERVSKASAMASAGANKERLDALLADALSTKEALEAKVVAMDRQREEQLTSLHDKLAAETERAAAAESKHAALREELDRREQAAARRDAERDAQLRQIEQQLEEKKAAVAEQSAAIDDAVAQVEALSAAAAAKEKAAAETARRAEELLGRCASQEQRLAAKEAEVANLQEENTALASSLEKMKTLSTDPAHDMDALVEQVRSLTAERDALVAAELGRRGSPSAEDFNAIDDSIPLSPEKGGPEEEEEGEGVSEVAAVGTGAASAAAELRKAKRSLRRMASERAGLKRRLERQAALLIEAQEKVGATELQVNVLEAELARLRMEEERGQRAAAATSPGKTPARWRAVGLADGAATTTELLAFDRLEAPSRTPLGSGSPAETPLPPVVRMPTSWLTTIHDMPIAMCASEVGGAAWSQAESGGLLYHVGLQIAEDAGLLSAHGTPQNDNAHAWSRLLLQVQHSVQSRGAAVFSSSAYAADCAQFYYALLLAAGLLWRRDGGADGDSASTRPQHVLPEPVRWALVVAGLCQFAGPKNAEESGADPLRDAPPAGEQRWLVVEQMLNHVSSANRSTAGSGTASTPSFYGAFAGSAHEEALALSTLRALLAYDDGPVDSLFGCDLHKLVLQCCAAVGTHHHHHHHTPTASIATTECTTAESASHAWFLPVARLLLRLSRETALLRSSATWPLSGQEDLNQLATYARAVLGDVCPSPPDKDQESQQQSETAYLGACLRLYLDGTVLPLTLAAVRVLTNARLPHHDAAATLMTCVSQARAKVTEEAGGGALPDSPLSADHLESLVDWFATLGTTATERELLRLYKENAMYRGYVGKLLLAIERK